MNTEAFIKLGAEVISKGAKEIDGKIAPKITKAIEELSPELKSFKGVTIKPESPVEDCFNKAVVKPVASKFQNRTITVGTDSFILNPTERMPAVEITHLERPAAGDNIGINLKDAGDLITFTPAKTLEEAEAYAKNILGLTSVDYNDKLHYANWTNEAFTDILNKTKNRKFLPSSINVRPYEMVGDRIESNTLAWHCSGGITVYSRAIEEAAIDGLDKLVKSWTTNSSNVGYRNFLHSLYPKEVIQKIDDILMHYAETGKIGLKPAIIARDFEKEYNMLLNDFSQNHNKFFGIIIDQNKDLFKFTKDGNIYTALLKDNHNLTADEALKVSEEFSQWLNKGMSSKLKWEDNFSLLKSMGNIFNENKRYLSNIDSVEKMPQSFDIVFHENGHFLHERFNPTKAYEIDRFYNAYESYFSPYRSKIKTLISERGADSPSEYVPERIRLQLRGIKIEDKELDDLYQDLGGFPLNLIGQK